MSYCKEQPIASIGEPLYPFTPQSWITPSNLGLLLDERPEKAHTYQVQLTRLYSAVMELEHREALELSSEMVDYYIGSKVEPVDGLRPYLVRGVSDNPGMGRIAGAWLEDKQEFLVFFRSLGKGGKWFDFVPLVVYLPEEPKKVWVTVGGAL
jgi:hypothetical protein